MWNRMYCKSRNKSCLPVYILIVFLFLSQLSCMGNYSSEQIDFLRTEPSPQPVREPQSYETVRFAITAGNTSENTVNMYGELLTYIGVKTGYTFKLLQKKTYAEINELLRSGDVDFAIISSGSYVDAREKFGLESVVVPVVNGQAYGYSYVIVKADSGIEKFEQLRGRTYAFTHPSSTYGRLVPVYKLAVIRETPNSFFSRYIFTYSNRKSIEAVQGGLVDGASVYGLVFDNMSVTSPRNIENVSIIEKSPPYGLNPVVASPHTPQLLKQQLSRILQNLHSEQAGQRILKGLNFDRFVQTDEASYQSIRKMQDFVKEKTEHLKRR